MRLYPGDHKITLKNSIDPDLDIPLAYINLESNNKIIEIFQDKNIKGNDELTPLIPYNINPENPYDLNKCYIDDKKNLVDNASILQRYGNSYYYIPKQSKSFIPENFNYTLKMRKCINYTNDFLFNIKATCVDNEDLTFSNKLIKFFADTDIKKDNIPENITINNGDIETQSIIKSQNSDFLFIESINGDYYYDYKTNKDSDIKINIEELLENTNNIWISVDNYKNLLPSNDENCSLVKPVILNNTSFKTNYLFNISTILNDTNFINIFNELSIPALIYHYNKKGYVIITHKKFFEDVAKNIKLFYSILSYVYFNSYVNSPSINQWITDEVPDYVVMNNKVYMNNEFNFTSISKYEELFKLKDEWLNLVDVSIDKDFVNTSYVTDTTGKTIVIFKKDKTKYQDLEKPAGAKSIYVPSNKVIFFNDFVYELNENLIENGYINSSKPNQNSKLKYNLKNNILYISINNFINSRCNIYINKNTALEIPLTETINYKTVNLTSATFYIYSKNNILNYVNESNKKYEDIDGTVIAKIIISEDKKDLKIYDIRQRGGGLKESEADNYNLLDIGNINGRPFRKSSTLIITLPKKYEKHKDILYAAIRKHCVSEEYPIFIFEDEEE